MQSLRLLASDLQKVDIAQLNPEAIGNIKKLSVSPGSSPHGGACPLHWPLWGFAEHCPALTLLFPVNTVPFSLSFNSQEE